MIRSALVLFLLLPLFEMCGQSAIDTAYYQQKLNEIEQLSERSPEQALGHYKELRAEAKKNAYDSGVLIAALGLATTYQKIGEAATSKKIADSVVIEAQRLHLKNIQARALQTVAWSSYRLNMLYTAAESAISALAITEGTSETKVKVDLYRVLGNIYNDLGDHAEGRKYFVMGMELAKSQEDQWGHAVHYYNYANTLVLEKKHDQALTILNGLSEELQALDTANALSLRCYLEQARLECRPKDPALVDEIYNNLRFLEKNVSKFPRGNLDLAPLYLAFADYYLMTKNAPKAKYYLDKLGPLAKGFGQFMELLLLLMKSEYHELVGNTKKALEVYRQYDKEKLEATRNKERDRIHELKLRFDTEKKDIELASKDLELQLLAESAEKQRIYLVFVFAGVFVLGLIIFVIYLNYRNRLLNMAKRDAMEAAEAKSLFLDVMTHELRTPLSTIAGSVYLLRDEKDQNKREGLLKGIQFSSEYLNKLIENTILLKTLGDAKETSITGPKEPSQSEFNCKALVEGVCESLAHSEKNNRVEISIEADIPEVVVGPELDLSRILVNLISNSDKFTNNGLITIAVQQAKALQNDTIELTFSVSDNGDGIKQEEKDRIFEAFYSGNDYKDYEYPGMGLGLNLVKGLLEKHGTSPKLQSVYGLGTTISFTMPFGIVSKDRSVSSSQAGETVRAASSW